MTPPDPREILEERARALAKPLAAFDKVAGAEMLAFGVGRERFAIESQFVFAVFRLPDLVPLPGARVPVVGLTRWRGDVLTLLDIRRVVGSAPGALDDLGRVIVVGTEAPEFGVLADTVDDIVRIDLARLHATPAERKTDGVSLLLGVTSDAIHVIDAATLIARQTNTSSMFDAAPTTKSAPAL